MIGGSQRVRWAGNDKMRDPLTLAVQQATDEALEKHWTTSSMCLCRGGQREWMRRKRPVGRGHDYRLLHEEQAFAHARAYG